MTDWFLALIADWGALALGLVTFLSCLAVPVPSSMMMLAAGAFVASGDLSAGSVGAAALTGAVAGDQLGYGLGRWGYARAEGWLRRSPMRAAVLDRARDAVQRRGTLAVFLSRWMFSVLGPYVNLLAGGAGMRWATFSATILAGEAVWVVLYIGLGYAAGGQIEAAAHLAGNAAGLMASLALAAGLAGLLWRVWPRGGAA